MSGPITLEVLAERLENFQKEFHEHRHDMKDFINRSGRQEKDAILAKERCVTADHRHDQRLDALESGSGPSKATFWTAVAALLTAMGTAIANVFGGGAGHH